jgi:drug/metabolite transporter (DMT)-like permease
MSQSLVQALIAMVCYGLSDFVYKQAAAAQVKASHFLLAQACFFGPLVTLYALASGGPHATPSAIWGCLAGLFSFLGLYNFTRSLRSGPVSTYASIFRMNFIVTAVLVILLLGEPFTLPKAVGLALSLVAVWLLVGGESASDGQESGKSGGARIQIVLATLAFGASNFFHTAGLRHGAAPETLAVAQALAFFPLAAANLYLEQGKLEIPLAALRYGAPAALLLLAATISLLRGVAVGQASVLVPIAQMGFVIAALLGIIVFREPLTVRKAAGLLAAFGALSALAAT